MNDGHLSPEEHALIFKNNVIPQSGLEGLTSQAHPRAVLLAGQPGSGKGRLKDDVLRNV